MLGGEIVVPSPDDVIEVVCPSLGVTESSENRLVITVRTKTIRNELGLPSMEFPLLTDEESSLHFYSLNPPVLMVLSRSLNLAHQLELRPCSLQFLLVNCPDGSAT